MEKEKCLFLTDANRRWFLYITVFYGLNIFTYMTDGSSVRKIQCLTYGHCNLKYLQMPPQNMAPILPLYLTQIHFHVSYCFVTINIFGVIPFFFIVLYLVASQIHHRPTPCCGNKQPGISDTFIFLNHAWYICKISDGDNCCESLLLDFKSS